MADLDDFLRKAAEKRKQRQQNVAPPASRRPETIRPTSSAPQSNAPYQRYSPNLDRAEIVEAEVIEPETVVVHGVHLRSNVPQSQHLAQQIDLADDRMLGHVKEVFEHRVGHLKQQSGKAGQLRTDRQSMTNEETVVVRSPENQIGKDLLRMLSQPQALKVAFIASEIFNRKF